MKDDRKKLAIIREAARLLRDYPEIKYYEAIEKAKEVLEDEIN